MSLFGGNENHCRSGQIMLFIDVYDEEDENRERVELDSVVADRTAEEGKRSEYDWFIDDVWAYGGADCVWPDHDLPESGRYKVLCHIEGWWSPHTPNGPSEYDEELVVESIERVADAWEPISALAMGGQEVACYIREKALALEGHKMAVGFCREKCGSYSRTDKEHLCAALGDFIVGPGHPCIPWLYWSRLGFEQMFEACGCPHSDQDPVEWIGFLKWAIEERDVEIEWLLDKLVDTTADGSYYPGLDDEEIRKRLIAEKHEMLKARVEQMKKERED